MLGTTTEDGRPRIVLKNHEGVYALSARGWQRIVTPPAVEEVRLRLRRSP